MFGSKEEYKGMCGCCDGKDEHCRCIHHRFGWWFVKALAALVVLLTVFAAGVAVGKFSAHWHAYKSGTYQMYQMMPDGNQRMPMQYQYR
ncbi:MAG: hypothetical protein Q8Q39_00670 [bacterium]|nr:hypothetical protein [bacterium]